jgi:hypothetical protein
MEARFAAIRQDIAIQKYFGTVTSTVYFSSLILENVFQRLQNRMYTALSQTWQFSKGSRMYRW